MVKAPPPRADPLMVKDEAPVQAALRAMAGRRPLPESLTPRLSAVIPQLLHALRQEDMARQQWVERVARDQALTAEVLRIAHSARFRTRDPVRTLDGALALIGEEGLRAAITRVVLKPILSTRSDRLAGRAAERAWATSDALGPLCAQQAEHQGIDWFDGFLAGTVYPVGYTAVCRTLDLAGLDLASPWSEDLDHVLEDHARQLFSRLAEQWQLSPLLSEAVADWTPSAPTAPSHPLGIALASAARAFMALQADVSAGSGAPR